MGSKKGEPHHRWTKVEAARERFRLRAKAYADLHFKAVKGALKKGDFGAAADHSEWALSHVADTNEQGQTVRVIESSVDKQIQSGEGPTGPKILIGFQFAGALPTVETKALPEPLDVVVEEVKKEGS